MDAEKPTPAKEKPTVGFIILLAVIALIVLWGVLQTIADLRWGAAHPLPSNHVQPGN